MSLPFFLQVSAPPPGGAQEVHTVWIFMLIIPMLMVIIGMTMGFQALKDIRLAEGRLGGAMTATLAAGFVPSIFIVLLCGGGMVMLVEEILPRDRSRIAAWPTAGGAVGVWLSFLMMRGMYRQATGWVRPAPPKGKASQLTVASIVLTITGGALLLVLMLTVHQTHARGFSAVYSMREGLLLFDLAVLVAGVICGVLAREEKAARVCAVFSCMFFLVLVLLFIA